MKKMLGLMVAVLFVVGMSFGQEYQYDNVRASITGTTTTMNNFKFAAGDDDTSQVFKVAGWSHVALVISVKDSISIDAYYHPSYDGQTWGARVHIDSLTTATATSDAFVLPAEALSFPFVKFSWDVNVFREGFTADTLSLKVYRRK